jgi:uncharacterized protein (TIGR02118 family)
MIKFIALWNIKPGVSEAEFESWYVKHMDDAKRIPGLTRYTVSRLLPGPQGKAPYYRMAELCFANEAEYQRAFASKEWQDSFVDAKNYIADHVRYRADSTDVLDRSAKP